MYIKHIHDENIGPIEKAVIDFPFNENGTPKPVILVGENGSGKSTILSNIVDALFLLADEGYTNAMVQSDDGIGKQYYKALSPVEIRSPAEYLLSFIQFELPKPVNYIFKSGNLSLEQAKKIITNNDGFPFSWNNDINLKEIVATKEDAQEAFEKGVVCYFGPDRYEKPFWQGDKYSDTIDSQHPSIRRKYTGKLNNPIAIKNVNNVNTQWVIDVLVDSRIDLQLDTEKGVISPDSNQTILAKWLFNSQTKSSLESILSRILGMTVYLTINNRKQNLSRLNIVEKGSNRIVSPTLDSLSTGQIALFNIFSTIVKYADENSADLLVNLNSIRGIVVIDEIELHLHSKLQKEVLPQLIKLFPQIQFIVTTHSPLFLLGMQEAFGENGFEIFNMPTAERISVERFSEFQRAYDYFKSTATYQKETEEKIKNAISEIVTRDETLALVITEGATDWKHMKTAYIELLNKPEHKELLDKIHFKFLEYESQSSGAEDEVVLEMGNTTLCSICESYSKIPNEKKYIFIADRDDDKTNKRLSIDGQKYKSWGNNVYSFILPLPVHRSETPNICIEHYYDDNEIKTEIECDGIKRRLYIGNEFDERGLAVGIDRFCEKKNKCGADKYGIIDGSSGERVTSLENQSGTNYALPKMDFANFVKLHPEEFNFDSFLEPFRIIKEILTEGVDNA